MTRIPPTSQHIHRTRERLTTHRGPVMVDGWRHIDCPWLAVVEVHRGTGYTIHHPRTGTYLLGDGDDIPLRPACETIDEALGLLVRLSGETWLRDLEHPAGQDAADRLGAIVDAWRSPAEE